MGLFQPINTTDLRALGRRIATAMRTEVFRDEATDQLSTMVWIPRFTIPADSFGPAGNTWPSQTVEFGGFYVDKYECGNAENTGPVSPALLSAPGLDPVAGDMTGDVGGVTHDWAAGLADARMHLGRATELVRLRDWASLVVIPPLLGHAMRGNINGGGDPRDTPGSANVEGVAGVDNIADIWRAGTSPNTHSLTGGPDAPVDVLGNLGEMMQETAPAGRLTIERTALVADAGGISAADTQLTIDTIDLLSRWPAASGVIQIEDELIKYTTLTDGGDGTAVLGGLTRGHRGTTAAIHADNVAVTLLKEYCIIPGGMSLYVYGLANTTDPVTFTAVDALGTPGKAAIAVNDLIICEAEILQVTAVAGASVTVSRGYGGTTPASHANWSRATVVSSQLSRSTRTLTGYVRAFRTDDADIEPLLIPALATTTQGDAELADQLVYEEVGQATSLVIVRGGSKNVSTDRYGWGMRLRADTANGLYGVRCRWMR